MSPPLRSIAFHNMSVSDEAIVELLVAMDGAPIASFSAEDITLTGEGRWEPQMLYL